MRMAALAEASVEHSTKPKPALRAFGCGLLAASFAGWLSTFRFCRSTGIVSTLACRDSAEPMLCARARVRHALDRMGWEGSANSDDK